MSLNWPIPSHNFAAEYQVSSWPFLTSSAASEVGATPIQVSFPFVTRWVQVFNTNGTAANTLRVGVTSNGVLGTTITGANYILLNGGQATERLELKCNQLWFLGGTGTSVSFSVVAGLTNVNTNFPAITGSNGFTGVG